MDIIGSLMPLTQALDYHLARQNLLTANLAHVDTPGYRARELYRVDGFDGALRVALDATDPRHLAGADGGVAWHVEVDRKAPVGFDGNSVDLDREAVKVASNNLRYDALSTMVKGSLDSLRWAAQDAR
ncbi:MAG: flagellar basal body rod protein FlgB [Myxococcota bacterium]